MSRLPVCNRPIRRLRCNQFAAEGDRLRVSHVLPSDPNYGAELTIYIEGSPEGGFVLYYGREAFASSGLLDGQVVLSKGGRPLVGTGAAAGTFQRPPRRQSTADSHRGSDRMGPSSRNPDCGIWHSLSREADASTNTISRYSSVFWCPCWLCGGSAQCRDDNSGARAGADLSISKCSVVGYAFWGDLFTGPDRYGPLHIGGFERGKNAEFCRSRHQRPSERMRNPELAPKGMRQILLRPPRASLLLW